MQGDRHQHGYDLLAHLRRLETRIARLQKRWQTFRADPRPERLEEFRRAFAVTDRALGELAGQLGEAGPGAGREAAPFEAHRADPRSPDARAVVEAGRTLDHVLAEVSRAWGFLRRDPDPTGLGGLADRLARAEAAAAVLSRALAARDSLDDDGVPPADRHRAAATPEAGSLDAILTRVRDDWEHLRRDPAPDRAGILRGELAEARRLAEALGSRMMSPEPPDPETARYLTGMNDAVRFAPYRDAFTGLYNRQGFDALAGAELKRCRRYSRSFGLLLIETQAADLAELRITIGTLQSLLRGYDLISRYSDRRLAVGLPEAEGAETRRIAARLLRALQSEGRSSVRHLSYALMPEDGATLAALFEGAETRLEGRAEVPDSPA
jgi:GGDEF domain-containing protein